MNLPQLSLRELLALHSGILSELKNRNATRSVNNPTGDYAEYLFAQAFNWTLENNSKAGYDATDRCGNRFQIKSRRLAENKVSERRLGTMRNLELKNFDSLAAVLFDENYNVFKGIIIPYEGVMEIKSDQKHVNGSFVILRDTIWTMDGIIDATEQLKNAEHQLNQAS